MPAPYLNRELSWLEFNQRVLNEALRSDLPLLERVKFLAITASNMDEFFQVRVGGLILMQRSGRKAPDPSGMTPQQQLQAIHRRVGRMVDDQYELLNESLLPEMAKSGIRPLKMDHLTGTQMDQVAAVFEDSVFPLLTPLAVALNADGAAEPLLVPALQLIVACRLVEPDTGATRYAVIPIPETITRRVPVKSSEDTHAFVWIEDVVAWHADDLFPGEKVSATTCFRVTRNGDIAVQEEDAIDLAGEMEEVLTARRFSDTVRLEMPKNAPRDLGRVVREITRSGTPELVRANGPIGLSSLMDLAFLPGFDQLRDEEWPPQTSAAIVPGDSMFETIAAGDVLLHHPYESFEPVLRLIEEAAVDPDVIAIKQVLYRTARQSRIIDALILAAENGKHVTALVELKARFDEARNLHRADELQRAGAQIVYGVKGLKTHAKICLIVRREGGHLRRYAHLGTGNYNESTAKLYTDISYLTCKPEFGHDASLFFNAVTGRSKLLRFQRLVPAPTAMKPKLLELIAGETERAKQGLPARILAKVNSLQDPDIILALYRASQAGVEVKLNIRGICCLKPGDARWSKNIEVVSVIDRFLEHARLFYFHQGGTPEVFIASADWMGRNLERRVELMIPIEEPALQRRLVRILETFFQDNVQASKLMPDGTSQRIAKAQGQRAFRAQAHFFNQARKAAKAREHERSMTFEPHVPAE
ncbi:polyphosphate kinase 1 [Luteolibacter ambystomatis]|uniref:Polyphosphate kinase n=1 Tax=Luteolibacter ambystomatis TaxID=2824561 RepID=A0A975J1J6_9BACT|nr:polyphosphate kinase 1 [Luteolibacter ambystomatis]QUE52304.1 polyphosphate kinase 1 [Luteolibacter ambystomatis]